MDFFGDNFDAEEKRRQEKFRPDVRKPLSPENEQIYKHLEKVIGSMKTHELNHNLSESGLKMVRIPLFGGRPERDTIIGSDDITNLQIALETCKTFKEFFTVV